MKDLSNEYVIHQKKGDIDYLQFRKLLEYTNINHLFSLNIHQNYRSAKANGTLTKAEMEACIQNYESLGTVIDVKAKDIVKPNQKHTDHIVIVQGKINDKLPDFNLKAYENTDGLVTNKQQITLATTSADCILLLIYDPVKNVIANVHSGWRGTIQRIGVHAIDTMIKQYDSNPQDIICCICPSIRKCHFEVDTDVKELFEQAFPKWKTSNEMIQKKDKTEKWYIDTVWINKALLKQKGLLEENIIDAGICSVCNSDIIHSYRVEKENYQLNTALIQLNNESS